MTDSFIMYRSFHEAASELSDEEYGRLMRVINEYALNDNEPECGGLIGFGFKLIKPQLDSNKEKRQKYEKAVDDGKRGGRQPAVDRGRIRELLAEGKTPAEVSKELGCSRQAVYRGRSADGGTRNKTAACDTPDGVTGVTFDKKSVTDTVTGVTDSVTDKQKLQKTVTCNTSDTVTPICNGTINDNDNDNVNENENDDEGAADKGEGADSPGMASSSSSSFTPPMIKGRLSSLGFSPSDNDCAAVAGHLKDFVPEADRTLDYLDYMVSLARASYKSGTGTERNWLHWYLTVDFKHNMYRENLPGFAAWLAENTKRQSAVRRAHSPGTCPGCGKGVVEKTPGVFYCASCSSMIEFDPRTARWKPTRLPAEPPAAFTSLAAGGAPPGSAPPIPEELY